MYHGTQESFQGNLIMGGQCTFRAKYTPFEIGITGLQDPPPLSGPYVLSLINLKWSCQTKTLRILSGFRHVSLHFMNNTQAMLSKWISPVLTSDGNKNGVF